MQRLRTARLLARLVLAWFVLCLGAAAAASALQPTGLEMVCSGGSMKSMPADGGDAKLRVGYDCPLCGPGVVPPPAPVTFARVTARNEARQPAATPALTQATAEAPPARGPPAAA